MSPWVGLYLRRFSLKARFVRSAYEVCTCFLHARSLLEWEVVKQAPQDSVMLHKGVLPQLASIAHAWPKHAKAMVLLQSPRHGRAMHVVSWRFVRSTAWPDCHLDEAVFIRYVEELGLQICIAESQHRKETHVNPMFQLLSQARRTKAWQWALRLGAS